jgi:hypothetical protein
MIFEIADRYSSTAATMAKMGGKSQMSAKTEMIGYLDSQVWQILAWLRGSDDLVNEFRPNPHTTDIILEPTWDC